MHGIEALSQCKPACYVAVLLHSLSCSGSPMCVEHSPVAMVCVTAACADQSSQTELHLLHATTLQLISKQQLPAGCTAAAISPNSCCIASIHQPAPPDPESTLEEQHDPQLHLTEADLQLNPVSQPQQAVMTAGVLADDTDKTSTGTFPRGPAEKDANCSTSIRGGQKRKREETPHTTVVCFQGLPAEVLTGHMTAGTQADSGLQTLSGRMVTEDIAAEHQVNTVKAEDGTMPGSDKAWMKSEFPTEQTVALQVNSHSNIYVLSVVAWSVLLREASSRMKWKWMLGLALTSCTSTVRRAK